MQAEIGKNARKFCAAMVACTVLSTLAVTFAPARALAYDSDAALESDGFLCTRQIARSERKYGIPLRLLGAIANAESGRRHQGLGVQVPWPWTINAAGTPYLFHTKQEAVAKVRDLRAKGVKSIDVGCMQVNLMHHPDAFASINQAFEPSFNVDYAARYLRGHYDETGSWKTAVGHYHSRTPEFGQKYIARVYNQWYNLAGSVARARGQDYAAFGNRSGVSINGRPGRSTVQQQRPAKKYESYIRSENTGQQIAMLAKPAAAPSANIHVVRPGGDSRQAGSGMKDLSVVRPARTIAKIETAPGTLPGSDSAGPLVVNITPERPAKSAKIISVSDSKSRDVSDERILKFVD